MKDEKFFDVLIYILIGVLVIFMVFSICIESNKKIKICENEGMKYNYEGYCIKTIGNKVKTYELVRTDWTGLNYKININEVVPN